MDPLISTSQLASRLQKDLDASTADLAVAGASGMIRSIARQTISFVAQETIELPGGGGLSPAGSSSRTVTGEPVSARYWASPPSTISSLAILTMP